MVAIWTSLKLCRAVKSLWLSVGLVTLRPGFMVHWAFPGSVSKKEPWSGIGEIQDILE